jgi:hypothetical protein
MTRLVPILLILLIATGCTCATPAPNQPPTAYIDSITPAEASVGTKVTFEGHGTDVDGTVVAYRWRSSLDGDLGPEASFDTSSLSVGNHTIYLKVQDNNGAWSEEVSHIITVEAVAIPIVSSFEANPTNISGGQSSTLSWNVLGATTVTIEPRIGDVASTGTELVSPAATTTYTLTATNTAGSTTATVQVVVSAVPSLPVINSFTASPENITPGGSSTLSWNVSGATTVSIDQGIGSVALVGTETVSPAVTTTYTLTATNAAGSTTASVTVVIACPTGQLLAEYYNYTPQAEPVFSGAPVFSQCEDSINYDWSTGGPGHGIGNDYFLARWTGTFSFDEGGYTFIARVDDGVRLWVDDSLIIDEWRPQAATEFSVTHELLPGEHQVKVEYFERMGAAVCQVRWEKAAAAKPDLVITDISKQETDDGYAIKYTIKNQGNAEAPSSVTKLWANGGKGLLGLSNTSDVVEPLAPGASLQRLFSGWTYTPCTPAIKVVADADNVVAESNEDNNTQTMTFTVETVYDFVDHAVDATWTSVPPETSLTFGGSPASNKGFVRYRTDIPGDPKVLETHPYMQRIWGDYQGLPISKGEYFFAQVGSLRFSCDDVNVACEVKFRPEGESDWITIVGINVTEEKTICVPLQPQYFGRKGDFRLTMISYGNPLCGSGLWFEAKIIQ